MFYEILPMNFTKTHSMSSKQKYPPDVGAIKGELMEEMQQNPPRMLENLNISSQKIHVLNLIPLLKPYKSSGTPPKCNILAPFKIMIGRQAFPLKMVPFQSKNC